MGSYHLAKTERSINHIGSVQGAARGLIELVRLLGSGAVLHEVKPFCKSNRTNSSKTSLPEGCWK